jgi:Zn-dependent protease
MQFIDSIFYIAILVMSIVLHEVSHGFMAEYFGDHTARYAGRLTINPIKHLDPFGSIILPAPLVLSGTNFLFGWAKPVPYNPANLRNEKWGTVAVAAAGVISNLLIAFLFGLIIRLTISMALPAAFYSIISLIVIVNLGLAIFNLVPIPPLDGSKIFFAFLSASFAPVLEILEKYAFVALVIFIVFFSDILLPILTFMYQLATGLAF